ncbi:MAG: hypothetical protein GY866_25120 [Proteobacteria bacterium]|nr:hypothetical protein [Pseudomonadota bacterium]
MDVGKQTSFLKEILSCIYDATGSQYAFYRLLGIDLTGFIENLILSAGSEQIGFEFDEELQSFTIWENAMLADEYMEDDDEFKQNVLKMIEQADCQWEPRLKIDQFKNG